MANRNNFVVSLAAGLLSLSSAVAQTTATPPREILKEPLKRLTYNNEGLEVDLGVGLWGIPIPVDYDGDGVKDLLVSCPDRPYKGLYF